jgi:F-type H+-transporting ATPase subunit b
LELSWSTFALEAVNFLVLVWILKHFLYKPVLEMIARRRAAIDQTLEEADRRHAEARALEEQSRERLAAWEREREEARDALNAEIATERTRRLEEVQQAAAEARRKADVVAERERAEADRRREEAAVASGLAFTSRLLERLAGPELEARLIRMAVEDLQGLSDADREAIGEAVAGAEGAPVVTTAFALPDDIRKTLTGALAPVVGRDCADCAFREDSALVAGVRVSVGPWVLKANLADELDFFRGTDGATG